VGLAFQAKMIEAWMVLPAFGLVYLLSGPGALKRRIGQLVLGGAVVAVVSVSWMTWVSLVPAVDRPYVDGSQTDSPYEQVFAYNGFGRFGDQTPLQVLAGQTPGLGLALSAPPVAPTRLLRGDLGHATGWLLPAALLVAGWGIISRRGRPRTDRLRACYVLWGGWVATFSAVFSLTTTINAYYTAALAPAVAAVFGAGVAGAWSEDRSGAGRRIGLVLVVASTTAYAAWLVVTAGSVAPSWLAPASVLVGIVAVGIALGAIAVRGDTCWAAALVAGLVAAVLAPAVASAELVVQHQGALDTPFESMAARQAIDALFVRTPAEVSATLPRLEQARGGAPYLLATQTAAIASVFIDASGQEALPIGGFDGSMPSPTLEQLQAEIRAGQFHLVLMAPSDDPRLQWIAAHCQNLGPAANGLHAYVCTPADAR
jgi:4-amino-4-deoxy-L-arabinose transferase-like glycosyltransferase